MTYSLSEELVQDGRPGHDGEMGGEEGGDASGSLGEQRRSSWERRQVEMLAGQLGDHAAKKKSRQVVPVSRRGCEGMEDLKALLLKRKRRSVFEYELRGDVDAFLVPFLLLSLLIILAVIDVDKLSELGRQEAPPHPLRPQTVSYFTR